MNKCGNTLLHCPKRCNNRRQLKRRVMAEHLEKECPNRPDKCVHCEMKDTHANIRNHDRTCPKKPALCPNQCGILVIRQDLQRHVQADCERTVIECQYRSVGCKAKEERRTIAAHEKDGNVHFKIALDAAVGLKCTVGKLEGTVEELTSANAAARKQLQDMASMVKVLQDTVVDLQNTVVGLREANIKLQASTDSVGVLEEKSRTIDSKDSITFCVSGFQNRKDTGETFTSPPFYVGCNGYCMALRVDVNGYGDGRGTHVSAFLPILEGKHDANLKWPFKGAFTFTLLNQLEDQNHRNSTLTFKVSDSVLVGSVWGFTKFIHQSCLAYNLSANTQYLKDDALYFRVSVEVADHKPWLQCKIDHSIAMKSSFHELEEKNQTLKSNESMTFQVSEYRMKKDSNERYYSPSFYTSPGGYHMAVLVDTNGDGLGKGTHMSVFALLRKGKYDTCHKWPFIGEILVTLLNQLEDKNHISKTISITFTNFGSTRGFSKFIAHSKLAHDKVKNTQYLKDDTLYFRVSVEYEADHKPWLQCTIKPLTS